MKKNHKKRGSIFRKLLVSYFVFSALAVITVFGCMIGEVIVLSGGSPEKIVPPALVREDGTLSSLDSVYQAKGWVEKLDEDYQVVEVYGTKATDTMSYTEKELLEATRIDGEKHEYYTFWEPISDGGYLFCYPREALTVTLNFEMSELNMTAGGKAVLVLMLFLLILEGLLISFYIYRKIRKPLKRMVDGMKRVANGEDHVNLSFQTEGEYFEIVEAFNTMIDALEKEKTEKEKMQQDRQQMLLELSHDLKTPLATIKSCATALEEGVVQEEERMRYYHTIATKSDRVNTMADDMFTMLKMESSDYCPDLERVDFCELVRQICAEYYEELSRFEVEINIPEQPAFVMADRKLITRTVANLLTNAVKYNQTGTEISIDVLEEKDQVAVRVSDDGEKITKEVAEHMFQAFVRGDKSRRSSGGTGLGLAIARGVAEKHGGTIAYRYEEEKNRFVLTLPHSEST